MDHDKLNWQQYYSDRLCTMELWYARWLKLLQVGPCTNYTPEIQLIIWVHACVAIVAALIHSHKSCCYSWFVRHDINLVQHNVLPAQACPTMMKHFLFKNVM